MKYTIFCFQQQALIDEGLNLEDALILERIIHFSGLFDSKIIDNESYKWIAYSQFKEEIPIIATSDSKIKRFMSKLEKKNIIVRKYVKKNNTTKVYFKFTEKIKTLTETNYTNNRSKVTDYNRPKTTDSLTGQNCSDANRPKVTGEPSGIEPSGIEPSGEKEPYGSASIKKFVKPTIPDI